MSENELLQLAKKAAKSASKQIKCYYNSSFEISFKSDSSLLTSADIAANDTIFKILSKSGVPICSEEQILADDERLRSEKFWLVDPLDGTREFVHKNDEFCVCIALIKNGEPILGVIMLPMSGEIFYANSKGAFVEILDEHDKILSKNALKNFAKNDKILYTGWRSKTLRERELADKLGFSFTQIGSAIKFARIAQSGGIYPRFSDSLLWDIAAGNAIVKFSGGIMVDLSNFLPINYSAKSLKSPKFIVLSEQNLAQKDKIFQALNELKS